MDSARLIINNQDLSTATELQVQTPVTGFTVVKAPKGPATPVRISKGDTARIQDIFGVASTEFPELYEAQLFNTGYDLYISAPYNEATIPVAYITSKGIFASAEPVKYTQDIENYVNGDDDADVSSLYQPIIAGESKDSGIKANFLIPFTHVTTFLKSEESEESNRSISGNVTTSWEGDSLKIKLPVGIETTDFFDKINTSSENLISQIRISNVPAALSKNGFIDLYFGRGESTDDKIYDGSNNVIGSFSKDSETSPVVLVINGNTSATEVTLEKLKDAFSVGKEYEKLRINIVYQIIDDLAAQDELFNIHGVLFPKYPSSRKMHLSFAPFSNIGSYTGKTLFDKNLLKITAYEEGAFHNQAHPVSITGSLDSTAKDGNGAFLGFSGVNVSYVEQDLLGIHILQPFNSDSQPSSALSYADVVLEGGSKLFGDEPSVQTLADTSVLGTLTVTNSIEKGTTASSTYEWGWTFAKEDEYSSVDIFFDSRRQNRRSVGDIFFSLAGDHQLAGFIFNETVDENFFVGNIKESLNYGNRYWNICNEAVVEFTSSGARFISPLTGSRALMQARIIEQRWGGVAPMYLNVTGLGGQLSSLVGSRFVKLKYKYNKDQQMVLDACNYNPVIRDNTYGVMVVGQKTCVNGAISDWSYIGHVSAFLAFQKEVKELVMIPQLGKANNDYYRSLRKQQVENILSKRISGNNRIWAGAVVDTSTADGVNDAATRRARKFVINVMVKVDVFSEYVILNFTNVDQDYAL